MVTRIAAAVLAGVDHPADRALFTLFGHEISGRDLILILGGLFLLGKSTYRDPRQAGRRGGTRLADACAASFASVIVQIMLLDIVFSLDSVITAVGMVDELWVMIAAVIIVGRDDDGLGRADQRASCTGIRR